MTMATAGRGRVATVAVEALRLVRGRLATAAATVSLLLVAPGAGAGDTGALSAQYVVVQKFPHQSTCFTEGFFLNGSRREVFESCGLYGRSYLRRYSLDSGETLQTGSVPRELFSEGLALLGRGLYMLTYKSSIVLEYDVATFREVRRHPFPYGEGWGLTTDGCDLLATTGSQFIFRLRPDAEGTLQLARKVQVTHQGRPVKMLNEIEYVTPKVWINQWHTNWLWRVDPETGVCELMINIQPLHRWHGEATPNGIGYSLEGLGEDKLLVTGKLWPEAFLLRLAPADLCGSPVEAMVGLCPAAPASACRRTTPGVASSTIGAAGLSQQSAAAAAPALLPASVPASASPPSAPAAPALGGGSSTEIVSAAASTAGPASVAAPAAGAAASGASFPATSAVAPTIPQDVAAVAPLPWALVVVSSLASVALGGAAIAVSLCLWTRRHHYKLAKQRGDRRADVFSA